MKTRSMAKSLVARRSPNPGVYIVRSGPHSFKIGRAANLSSRLPQLKTCISPDVFAITHCVETASKRHAACLEDELHHVATRMGCTRLSHTDTLNPSEHFRTVRNWEQRIQQYLEKAPRGDVQAAAALVHISQIQADEMDYDT